MGDWKQTIEGIVPAIVSIRRSKVQFFDTESASVGSATGFIVDAEQGLILSNRHVVAPGPTVGEATFSNHEEVPIFPIYCDPVHDFGFYRFDPAALKFSKPMSIPLAPENCVVGTEIRLVGNDNAEKLSILTGTIARVDRDAPNYGVGRYNDWNTFYIQAASSSSGGSSGSPVINIKGEAIALNSGSSSKAASAFYLPLDKVVRALKFIKEGKDVPRGTIQTVFKHKPFDEVRRLGVCTGTETLVRETFPEGVGMFVVDQTTPGSAAHADEGLIPGDVLCRVNGELVCTFSVLEEFLDDTTPGGTVTLVVERGGQEVTVLLPVTNLHDITPDRYFSWGGCVFNSTSYQMAKSYQGRVGGVFVSKVGYVLRRAGAVSSTMVIKAVGNTLTPDLSTFIDTVTKLPHGMEITFRYLALSDPHRERVSPITVDRQWFPSYVRTRSWKTGLWDLKPSPPPGIPRVPKVYTMSRGWNVMKDCEAAALLAPSIVFVRSHLPFTVENTPGHEFIGFGLIVDTTCGLVVVDQSTVTTRLADVTLCFGGSFDIDCKIVYIHPVHNFAIVQYDPKSIGESPVSAAKFGPDIEQSDDVFLVGLTSNQKVVARQSRVSNVDQFVTAECHPPRFRGTNVEIVRLEDNFKCVGGAVVDEHGVVRRLWVAYSKQQDKKNIDYLGGMPVRPVLEVLSKLVDNDVGVLKPELATFASLDVELVQIPLSNARRRGLPDEWSARIEESSLERRVLMIRRIMARSPASALLSEGDLLLGLEDTPLTSFMQVEELLSTREIAQLTVFRDGTVEGVDIPLSHVPGEGLDRVVFWEGAILQRSMRCVAMLGFLPDGVFCSTCFKGSPAQKYMIPSPGFLTEVNGVPTPDFDAFFAVVSNLPAGGDVRVTCVDLRTKVHAITLRSDTFYWPVIELVRKGTEWERVDHM